MLQGCHTLFRSWRLFVEHMAPLSFFITMTNHISQQNIQYEPFTIQHNMCTCVSHFRNGLMPSACK